MAHIQWKERYNIGYKDIDLQHRRLLALLNELVDVIEAGQSHEGVEPIIHGLCSYALTHFSTEERYLKASGYPGLARQEQEHAHFVEQVLALNQTYDPQDVQQANELRIFLQDWYLNHILKIDFDYVPHLRRYYVEAEIKAVIFDFGNVVSRFDNGRFLEGLTTLCGRPAAELKTAIYGQSTLTQDYEAGRIGSADFLVGISAICGKELAEADFLRAYTEIFTPIAATQELILKLEPRYRMLLLSNTSPWHYEHAIRTTPVFPVFENVTLSYEVGASKPDPRLFEDALAKLGLMAEECIYIDDVPAYAQAATEHLLHGITYTSPLALLTELRRLKVVF